MGKFIRIVAVVGAVGATLAGVLMAGAGSASAGSVPTTARPCTIDTVSFYFGGYTYGLGSRTFDLTLVDRIGVPCTLPDTPLVSIGGPPSQKTPIPVTIDGRGNPLTLRPDSPLHTTFYYSAPDTQQDTIEVSTLTLAMPDNSSRTTEFLFPGPTKIYSGGVQVTAWRTGLGLGQGEEAY